MIELKVKLSGDYTIMKRVLIRATTDAHKFVWNNDSLLSIYDKDGLMGQILTKRNYPIIAILVGTKLFKSLIKYPYFRECLV